MILIYLMKIKQIAIQYEKLYDTQIDTCGWILSVRDQKDLSFIVLNDGSNPSGLQLIVDKNLPGLNVDNLNTGTSLEVSGLLVKSPAQGQATPLCPQGCSDR